MIRTRSKISYTTIKIFTAEGTTHLVASSCLAITSNHIVYVPIVFKGWIYVACHHYFLVKRHQRSCHGNLLTKTL